MAKGLRSSVKKANRAKLRVRVFGPVEDARTERLSAKLLALASQSKTTKSTDTEMDVVEKQMDLDDGPGATTTKSSRRKSSGRVQKRGRGKPRNTLVFPVYRKGRRGVSLRAK
ncbi:MAG: hypothetical protein M1832_005738 [Thelocarpon impressellum]|nr:MAG: hypothetical protein M1832_005738 [Thelocarpon impressellum]